jgi:hypothetical protein
VAQADLSRVAPLSSDPFIKMWADTMTNTQRNAVASAPLAAQHDEGRSSLICPITRRRCEGDLSYLCEDYGCARKGGLSPYSEENL